MKSNALKYVFSDIDVIYNSIKKFSSEKYGLPLTSFAKKLGLADKEYFYKTKYRGYIHAYVLDLLKNEGLDLYSLTSKKTRKTKVHKVNSIKILPNVLKEELKSLKITYSDLNKALNLSQNYFSTTMCLSQALPVYILNYLSNCGVNVKRILVNKDDLKYINDETGNPGCSICRGKIVNEGSNEILIDTNSKSFVVKTFIGEGTSLIKDVKISYCPYCGKKL